MFRTMRRKDRLLTEKESIKILIKSNYGVLSLFGEEYPYGVPVNYAYVDGKLYFHSTSQESHKLDCIKNNNKVCFTVVSNHDVVLDQLSTNYESVILFGIARIIDKSPEKEEALHKMMHVLARNTKYEHYHGCSSDDYVMVEITPEHVSGKARK